MWWHTPAIPAPETQRQEDGELVQSHLRLQNKFKANLCCMRPCFNSNNKETEMRMRMIRTKRRKKGGEKMRIKK